MNLRVFYLTRRGISDGYFYGCLFEGQVHEKISIKRQKDLAICNSCSNFALKQRQRGAVSFEAC